MHKLWQPASCEGLIRHMLVWNIWSSSLEYEIKVEDVTSDSRDGQADLSVRCGRDWQELDRGHSLHSSLTIFESNIPNSTIFEGIFHLWPYSKVIFQIQLFFKVFFIFDYIHCSMFIGIEDVLTETRSETSILRIKCIGEKYLKGQLWSEVGRLYSSPPQTTLFNPSLAFLPIAELISRDSRWLTDAPDISLHYIILIILWIEISQNMQVCRVIIIRN